MDVSLHRRFPLLKCMLYCYLAVIITLYFHSRNYFAQLKKSLHGFDITPAFRYHTYYLWSWLITMQHKSMLNVDTLMRWQIGKTKPGISGIEVNEHCCVLLSDDQCFEDQCWPCHREPERWCNPRQASLQKCRLGHSARVRVRVRQCSSVLETIRRCCRISRSPSRYGSVMSADVTAMVSCTRLVGKPG